MKEIKFKELSKEHQGFLASLPQATAEDQGIPVFLESEKIFFISDFKMATEANKEFEKKSPSTLYRGGAVIKVISSFGTLVVPDERHNWWKSFAGIARFSEGHDLRLTGARELLEEAFVYSLDKKVRFVPEGCAREASLTCSSLDFTVEKTVEVDQISLLGLECNQTNKALEAVLGWDIAGINVLYSVSLEESWWAGDRSGVSVYAITHDGKIAGVFSGQQGFIEIPKYGIHETLKKYL